MTPIIDTTVIVDYLRGHKEAADYLNGLDVATVSIITTAEIFQGARDKNHLKKLERTLNNFDILSVSETISSLAVSLIKQYTLSHNLRIPDGLIAATALDHKSPLATTNIKHFSMIKSLKVIKPY